MSKQNCKSFFKTGNIIKVFLLDSTKEYVYKIIKVNPCPDVYGGWMGCAQCTDKHRYSLVKYGTRRANLTDVCLALFFPIKISKEEADLSLY